MHVVGPVSGAAASSVSWLVAQPHQTIAAMHTTEGRPRMTAPSPRAAARTPTRRRTPVDHRTCKQGRCRHPRRRTPRRLNSWRRPRGLIQNWSRIPNSRTTAARQRCTRRHRGRRPRRRSAHAGARSRRSPESRHLRATGRLEVRTRRRAPRRRPSRNPCRVGVSSSWAPRRPDPRLVAAGARTERGHAGSGDEASHPMRVQVGGRCGVDVREKPAVEPGPDLARRGVDACRDDSRRSIMKPSPGVDDGISGD